MNTLECLYYEDEPAKRRAIEQYLHLAFKGITSEPLEAKDGGEPFGALNVKGVSDLHKALKEISEHGQRYQLLCVDLLREVTPDDNTDEGAEKPEFETSGLRLVEEGRRVNERMGIIAISRAEQKGYAGLSDEFRAIAALKAPGTCGTNGCFFIPKDVILGKTMVGLGPVLARLGNIMLRVLADSNVIAWPQKGARTVALSLGYEREHYPTVAVVETVGLSVLEELAGQVLPGGYVNASVKCLAPGMSGAYVLHLDVPGAGTLAQRHVLFKVSNSASALLREIERHPKLGDSLGNCFVPYTQTLASSSAGWSAIGAHFAEGCTTMLKWLTDDGAVGDTTVLMGELFQHKLRRAYTETKDCESSPLVTLRPNTVRHAKIWTSIEDLEALASDYGAADDQHAQFDKAVLAQYLESGGLGLNLAPPQRSVFCLSHGDLHCRNIMVPKGGHSPVLIDPADSDWMHWARDPARFSVDLVVSGWDKGRSAHEWENFRAWRQLSARFVDGTMEVPLENDTHANRRVRDALEWCRLHLPDVFPNRFPANGPSWEFQLALAVEFMRSAYRPDVATPKKVLGLVAAHDALLQARNTLRGTA